MQDLVARDAKLTLEVRLHRLRVAYVSKHKSMRRAGRRQRGAGLLERVGVEVDTAHGKRVSAQVLAAPRLCPDVQVRGLQESAVTAPHVGNDAWLLIERLLVEDALDADAHHVGKVSIVHEARADDIELAVDPRLMRPVVPEDATGRSKGGLAQQVKHRPVREAYAKSGAALDDEQPGLAQGEQL